MVKNERDGVIEQLIEVGRSAVERGLVLASGGNLSARGPGDDAFVITAAGTWLDRLTPEDFIWMRTDGQIVGSPGNPSSEWKLHARTYAVRGDVNAVIHLHPQYSILLDALGHDIRLLTLDHASYVRSVGRIPYFPNGSDELADEAAKQAREHDCVMMAYHGCSSLGEDISMAYRRALNLEEAATQTYRMLVLGDATSTFPRDELSTVGHS